MLVTAVIPVRFGSTRFPGKPLADILGKPMVQWVHEAACAARSIDRVVVATDDDRIAKVTQGFGATVVRTDVNLRNGTERAHAVMQTMDGDLWLNIQGDEPLLTGDDLDAVVAALRDGGEAAATLAVPLAPEQVADPNCVKVVLDARSRALYFSRAPIPYQRSAGHVAPLLHVGVYGFRRELLARYVTWPPSALEQAEGLEQLRLLEQGERMTVVVRDTEHVGVDTPADCAAAARALARRTQG